MQVDAYGEVEQQLLGDLAHDLQDQAGVNSDGLLDAAQNAYDAHAVLDAFSHHWSEVLVDRDYSGARSGFG